MEAEGKLNLQSVDAIVKACGGDTKVGKRFGVDCRVVWNWRYRKKFPAHTHLQWQAILQEMNIEAPAELWGQRN